MGYWISFHYCILILMLNIPFILGFCHSRELLIVVRAHEMKTIFFMLLTYEVA